MSLFGLSFLCKVGISGFEKSIFLKCWACLMFWLFRDFLNVPILHLKLCTLSFASVQLSWTHYPWSFCTLVASTTNGSKQKIFQPEANSSTTRINYVCESHTDISHIIVNCLYNSHTRLNLHAVWNSIHYSVRNKLQKRWDNTVLSIEIMYCYCPIYHV